ncbi:MAG: hypothetical protein H7X95_02380, partial [Deltaproteobacteria bacterium]|nr:hypothetical protein [Deltaproteobacteria bacterium]
MRLSSRSVALLVCSSVLVGCSSSPGTPVVGTGGSHSATGGASAGGAGPGPGGSTGGGIGSSSGGQVGTGGTGTGTGGTVATGTGGLVATGGNIGTGGTAIGIGGGSGGSGVGSGGSTGSSPPGFFVDGYVTSTPWMGYLFTYSDALKTGTTISPTCTTTGCTPAWGAQACVTGNVAKDAASATYAGLAFHVINPKVGAIGT